jgi:NADH-quinone oxidoreductase subunit L
MLAFGGPLGKKPESKPGPSMIIPIVILIIFSIAAGIQNLPPYFKVSSFLSDLLKFFFPPIPLHPNHISEISSMIISASVSVVGITVTVLMFAKSRSLLQNAVEIAWIKTLRLFFFNGWGFDKAYKILFADTFLRITGIISADIIGMYGEAIAAISRLFSLLLNFFQNGNLRWYAASIAIGAIIITAIGVF